MPSQDLARGFTGTTANVPMHPRPQLRRDGWISLDGEWKFAVDELGEFTDPAQVTFTDVIVVPFAPEAPASGIGRAAPFRACWYQRSVTMPAAAGGAWWLNFGAVDYRTIPYANKPVVLLMGNEQQGLPDQLASSCDKLARIPQEGRADSLNLAIATGVMLFEIRRDALKLAPEA